MKFRPPTIAERGVIARAVAKAMHEAAQEMQRNQGDHGRLICDACGGTINWSGANGRSAGGCGSCREVRWPL